MKIHNFGDMMARRMQCAFFGVVAWSCYGSVTDSVSDPARPSPLDLYVQQIAVPKGPMVPKIRTSPNVPQAPAPQMEGLTVPQVPQMPQVQTMTEVQEASEMPQVGAYVIAQPIAEEPASPLAFLGGFAGGLAAGAALVYSLVQRTGQKMSAKAGAPNSSVVVSTARAPPMPALGRRRIAAVNMSATGGNIPAGIPACLRPVARFTVTPIASASRRTSAPKMEVGLLYSTTTGNTETVAGYIGSKTGLEPIDIADADGASVAAYDGLIVGAPTWHTGADTERSGTAWDEFIYGDLTSIDLSGKKVAIFGVGDSAGYADNFCDAMDELAECFKKQGAEIVGAVSTDGYEHEDSKSIVDGKFVGLACDEDNQPDMSEDRVNAWVDQIKGEGMPL